MSAQNNGSSSGIRVFKVVNRLKEKLGLDKNNRQTGEINPAAVAEAHQLIVDLCKDCRPTITGFLKELTGHWEEMRDMPQSEERKQKSEKIFTLAHEIKDVGSLCGYTLAAYFAESLRDYIGSTELSLKAQRVIIQAHVDAINAVQRQGLKDEAGPIAEELKKMVKIAVDKYK